MPLREHPPRKEATAMLCISHTTHMHPATNLTIVSREIEGPFFEWRGIHDRRLEK